MSGNEKYKNVKKFETKVHYIYDSEGDTIREEGISEVNPAILDGGRGEFYHNVGEGTAAIGLRIPIDEVKDIDSAIKKANEAGFQAKVIETKEGYKYLEISDNGYLRVLDDPVVKKLKTVAIDVSKEDYSDHIKDLPLELKTFILVNRSVEKRLRRW